jgi:hypothetical protein
MTDDQIIPVCRRVDGTYQVDGVLIISPLYVHQVLLNCATAAKKLVLSPMPHYWLHRCCSDENTWAVLPTPEQTFRPDQQKIRPLAIKFGPLQNLLTNANITVFYTLFL